MQALEPARKELRRASDSTARLKASTNLTELDGHWKEAIRYIERCWNKAQAGMRPYGKWQGWNARGEIEALRRSDSLLSYVCNARGADEHGIAEITVARPGGVGIGPAEGNSVLIQKLSIEGGVITELKSPHALKLTFEPSRLELVPVVNRGTTYPVPTEHLGIPLKSSDPISIASAAIAYYAGVLKRIDAEFNP